MEQYISKSALVAEIERRISVLKANESVISMLAGGMFVNEFKDLLSFLDTLEVKEEPVSEDLVEAARSYSNNLDNIYGSIGEQTKNAFKAGAEWQKEQMVLNDNNKEYHKVPSTTLKRLYMNEAKYELLKSDIMEGIVGDFEKGTTHSYLTIKIPMLLCPSNCAKGDKVKLIIVMEK